MTDILSLTSSLKMKKAGISVPQLPGIGPLNLFEDGPLNGQKILIIPDLFHSMKIYAPLINQLNTQFRLAIIDLPGHFSSAAPEQFNFDQLIDEYVQVVDLLGWSSFSVLGHGIGCQIAAKLVPQFAIQNLFLLAPTSSLSEQFEFRKITGSCCRSEISWDFSVLVDGVFKVAAGDNWKSIFALNEEIMIGIWEKYEQIDFRDNEVYYGLRDQAIEAVKIYMFQDDVLMKAKQGLKFFEEIEFSQEKEVVIIEKASHTPFLDSQIVSEIADKILCSFQTSFATK